MSANEGVFSSLFGCFCRTRPAEGAPYSSQFDSPIEVIEPQQQQNTDQQQQQQQQKGGMKLQPTFSATQKEPSQQQQRQRKQQQEQIDYFVSMEPTYTPPKKVVLKQQEQQQQQNQKSDSLKFEMSEVEMEFGMSNTGWQLDDTIAPPTTTKKTFASKKSKDSFDCHYKIDRCNCSFWGNKDQQSRK